MVGWILMVTSIEPLMLIVYCVLLRGPVSILDINIGVRFIKFFCWYIVDI